VEWQIGGSSSRPHTDVQYRALAAHPASRGSVSLKSMRLITAHKILIGSALGLALLFLLRSFVLYAKGHEASDFALGTGALALASALGLYLRSIWRK
jgi:hypothetical protein